MYCQDKRFPVKFVKFLRIIFFRTPPVAAYGCSSKVHLIENAQLLNFPDEIYCCISYAETWELFNLFAETKSFSYHICYENIGRKHNKIGTLKLRDRWQTDHGQTELSNMLVKKNVLNEINKERTFTPRFKDCRKIKRKASSCATSCATEHLCGPLK